MCGRRKRRSRRRDRSVSACVIIVTPTPTVTDSGADAAPQYPGAITPQWRPLPDPGHEALAPVPILVVLSSEGIEEHVLLHLDTAQ